MLESNTHRVAIIGAGMAGAAAARAFNQAGAAVTVFEKSRGTGGRLASKTFNDVRANLGAQEFTATSERFKAQVTDWQQQGLVVQEPSSSLVRTTSHLSTLTRDLLQSSHLLTGIRIADLQENNGEWTLIDTDHREHGSFHNVIITAPAPQAGELLSSTPFQQLKNLASETHMQPCWTLLLWLEATADYPPAPADNNDVIEKVFQQSSKHRPQIPLGQQMWVVQATATWSRQHLESEPETVKQQLLKALFRDCGTTPRPLAMYCHRWRYARPITPLQIGWAFEGGIGICGDWLTDGTVEGAYLSGTQLAKWLSCTWPHPTRYTHPQSDHL